MPMISNGNGPNLFETSIRLVFDSWPALQIALKNQFAGTETAERYNWFVEATTQWICEVGDLDNFELEEFFLNTMDKEFNTILDDLSETPTAKSCLKMWHLYKNTHFTDLNSEIERMKQNLCATQQSVANSTKTNDNDTSSDDDDDVSESDENNEEKASSKDQNNNYEQEMEGVEEGWTYVAKSGKHITK